eukprot:TRINITY_DN14729_c0_g1_i8.p1 TRINITY_DN14729_c0_g1~~TRINITY_DN14729_c0_g1_i8.p1  ORF type:complete len:579 (-),score=84.86 TRINITY_DN14729_c0_g1_i8:583-2187(-)
MKAYYLRQKAGKRSVQYKRPGWDFPPKFDGWNIDDDDDEIRENWSREKFTKKLTPPDPDVIREEFDYNSGYYDNLSENTQQIVKKLPVKYWNPIKSPEKPKPLKNEWSSQQLNKYIKKLHNYEKIYGNTMVPKFYWEDLKLGRWCAEIKYQYYKEQLSSEEMRKLNNANFTWSYDDIEARWWATFHEARRYLKFHGHLNMPLHQNAKQPTKESKKLKQMAMNTLAPPKGVKKWDSLWYLRRLEEQWDSVEPETKQYPTYLGQWIVNQKEFYKLRVLSPDKVKLLQSMLNYDFSEQELVSEQEYCIQYDQIFQQTKKALLYGVGNKDVVVCQEDMEFCVRLNQLREWMDKYFTSYVPQNVFDNAELGEWQRWIRRAKRRGNLQGWKIHELEKIKMQWNPHLNETQWWDKYHKLRKYTIENGDPHIPANFVDPQNPEVLRLSNFLQFNFKMYIAEKLSNYKLMALRGLGVRLEEPYGPAAKFLQKMKEQCDEEDWTPKPDSVYEDQTIRLAKKALKKKRGYLNRKFDVRQYFIPGL